MKKFLIIFCIAFFAMSALVSHSRFITSIYGTLEPAEAGKKVWAINGKDTVGVIPESGKFSIAVTAGTWKLYIEAMRPFKDEVVENIRVEEGKSTDAGVIRMRSDQ